MIVLGFAAVIAVGAVLLSLPFATQSGQFTPINQTVFTATSAVCVTGLVVQDTATYWTGFGQAVILVLIQIGGLGVVTAATVGTLILGRRVSLRQRSTMTEAIAAPKVGGIVAFTKFVVSITLVTETVGAVLMLPVFCRDYGLRGIWLAVFHSVSAFCNAGFDLMGTADAQYASLTGYGSAPYLNIIVMILIVFGGIGFLTWEDVKTRKWHLRKYRMQSKVVIITSVILILLPAVFLFFHEFTDGSVGTRILTALFQSVTTRTAGFNTVDLDAMSGAGKVVFMALMLIGGSPGSTAGGMKTMTIAVLVGNMIAVFRQRGAAHFFDRSIDDRTVKNAATILLMYISMFLAGGLVISVAENLPIGQCLFEAASAVGTVGLTLGITPQLHLVSQIVLILLMFFGRVGGLTIIYAAFSNAHTQAPKYPQEGVVLG